MTDTFHWSSARQWLSVASLIVLGLLSGCAAVSNPVLDGIPVRRLPPEVLGESKEGEVMIPLTQLRQKPPDVYRLAGGDVLGVWIEGVLGEKNQPVPVKLPEQGSSGTALGYPIPIRENGTVPLPLIDPVKVEGLTLVEAQARIIEAYTVKKKILQPGRERVIVTLIRPRHYNVLVLREDAGTSTFGSSGGFNAGLGAGNGTFFSESRKTAGFALELPAYENDVLNALTRSGGLPGPEAENEIIIERGAARPVRGGVEGRSTVDLTPDMSIQQFEGRGTQTIRIPIRYKMGENPNLRPEDIVLQSGDVVLIRLRKGEYFYTAGLIPPRLFPLPRDRDLDVIQALALVGAPMINGGINGNNITGALFVGGIGFPSPSHVSVLRKTVGGTQINISVNINRALRDPRERILIQPGDILVLQSTVDEALAKWFSFNSRFNWIAFLVRQRDFLFTNETTLP